MIGHIEHEYKFLLNNINFEAIKSYAEFNFKKNKSEVKINYYFDDDEFSLHNSDIPLNFRQNKEELSLQQKSNNVLTYNSKTNKIINSVYKELPKTIGNSYSFMECLITQRESFYTNENIRINFDTNYYLGCYDYEIEIEYNFEQKERVKMILRELGLTDVSYPYGKSSRFFMQLYKITNKN